MRSLSLAVVPLCLFIGCGGDTASTKTSSTTGTSPSDNSKPGEFRVLASFFPVYVFTKNVVGDTDGVSVGLMLPASKGCPHGYDLTPGDGKRIADADVLVMNGGGLEEFKESEIKAFNSKITIVESTKGLKLMEAMCNHDEEEEEEGHHHHHHESGLNPHSFTSPFLAAQQVINIGDALAKADPTRAEKYRKNAETYAAKLKEVGKELKESLAKAKGKKIVASHEIFDYLVADCGIEVVGEIQSGDGKDTPPKKLIEKIKKQKVPAIFTEPQYNPKAAEVIAKETGIPVFQLDPIATGPEQPAADHYEKTMRANIATLVKALGG